MTTSRDADEQGFVHCALFYRSQGEYVDGAVRFVVDGLTKNQPVLVAVPGDSVGLLHEALSDVQADLPGGEVHFADISQIARNPSRFLTVQDSFVARYPGARVRIVGQLVWPGRTKNEFVACVQHEASVNAAFAGKQVTALCLYDASRLEDDVLDAARTTHPLLVSCGSVQRNEQYSPDDALARCNQPLPTNPGAVTYTVSKSSDLRPARSFAVDYGDCVGLSPDGIQDLQLVATELASNSLEYTEGQCQLAFWRQNGHLVCEARDIGRLDDRLDDPLIGRTPPGASGTASRGLFLVNAISDLVRTHTTPGGTTIQAYLRFDPAKGAAG